MKTKAIIITILSVVIFLLSYFLFTTRIEKDKNVINFSSWGSQSEVAVLKSVIKDFEQDNPNIKINFIHIPENYNQKLHLLFASNLEPDVIFINNQNIQLYIKAGLIEDLSPYFENIDNTFFKEAINCFKSDKAIYAIPRDISNLVLYYNKEILKQSRVKLPEKIKDIYELKDILIKLTNSEHFGINFEDNPLYWLYFLASNGGGLLSDDKKTVIINSENSIEALNLYSDFVNKYGIAPSKSQIGSMTTAQMFINGKLAMYLSGRWMTPKFREVINFDWDIIEFPSSETNKIYIDSSGWAVTKKSKNKENAIAFIKYLSSKEAIDKFTQIGLIVPARKDSANSSVFLDKKKKPEHSSIFIKMLNNAKPTPVTKDYSTIIDIIKESTQELFSGSKRAEDIFNTKTTEKIERLL